MLQGGRRLCPSSCPSASKSGVSCKSLCKDVPCGLEFIADKYEPQIEFRLFQFDKPTAEKKNGLHAGQLKSYIQLCLALSEMAKELKTASPKPQQTENPKFAMRTWLIRLGLVGEEFSTARSFLTKNLDGDAAFRYGRA